MRSRAVFRFCQQTISKVDFTSNLTEEIQLSWRASDRGSYAKPLLVIITLSGVVGESLFFSTLQMQRWLGPDLNVGLST